MPRARTGPSDSNRFSISTADADGRFDVVYSWGVLHHTGAMWEAIRKAAQLVNDDGRFVIAIYQRTPMCGFWHWEKRLYNLVPAFGSRAMRGLYKSLFLAALTLTGRNPVRYVRDYGRTRGMSWTHDVHDWLGGYPYESATAEEIDAAMRPLGFRPRKIRALRDQRRPVFKRLQRVRLSARRGLNLSLPPQDVVRRLSQRPHHLVRMQRAVLLDPVIDIDGRAAGCPAGFDVAPAVADDPALRQVDE